MAVTMKKIIITHTGVIQELDYAYGPILSPFWCDVGIISSMISTGKKVYEVLDDGEKVLLTPENYNQGEGEEPGGGGGENTNNVYPEATPAQTFRTHLGEEFDSLNGIHKELRFYEGNFQYYNDDTHTWDTLLKNTDIADLEQQIEETGTLYAPIDHNHDLEYSSTQHDHHLLYSTLDHTHEEFTSMIKKASKGFIGDGVLVQGQFQHDLNTLDVVISVFGCTVGYTIEFVDANNINVNFVAPLPLNEVIKVVVIG